MAPALDRAAIADARADAYAALAYLVEHGIDDRSREVAALSPRIAPVVAVQAAESLAADHCHVFDVSAPPFEGLVMDPAGTIGNHSGAVLRARLQEIQVATPAGVEPESLPAQLRVMADLAATEAASRSAYASRRCAAMLDHLLRWLVPYEAAIARTGRAFPSALVAEIVDLAVHHRAELASLDLPWVEPPLQQRRLDLDDPDTDLRAIAEFLARAIDSGIVLTRDDIAGLGRRVRVPRGFGDRTRLLFNLLRTGAELGQLGAIVAGLDELVEMHTIHVFERLTGLGAALDATRDGWLARLAHTRALLRRIESEAPV